MPFSFALSSILAGNLLCLTLMNGLRLPTVWTLTVWPAAVASCWMVLRPRFVRRAPFALPWWIALAPLVLLTVPRLTYLAEWMPGAAVLAQADDYGRLVELIAMTQSPRYPLEHPANQALLLSHYYTALYPMAWLKLAVPWFTLKDAIVFGNLLYHALMLGATLECAPRLVRRRRGALLLVFLMTLFGGFDILMGRAIPFEHTEHWGRAWMGRLRELSSMYTAMYWTVHHMSAVWALVLAYVFAKETRGSKTLGVTWLLVAAAASSAFVAVTLPLVAWRELWLLAKRVWRQPWVAGVCALAAWTPLWIVMNRVDTHGWAWNPPPWSLALYVLAVCLVDLAGLPLWLAAHWRGLRAEERRWLAGFVAFLLVSYGLESAGYNNFMMRGGLVPTVCLMVAAARRRWPRWLLVAVLCTGLTTLRETATMTYAGLENSNWYWTARGLEPPAHVRARLRPAYPRVARDRAVKYYQPDAGDRRGMDKYNAERMVRPLRLDEMIGPEREIARRRD